MTAEPAGHWLCYQLLARPIPSVGGKRLSRYYVRRSSTHYQPGPEYDPDIRNAQLPTSCD